MNRIAGKKTMYRVIEDAIEISGSTLDGSGRRVGKPFPRPMSEDEIERIYYASFDISGDGKDYETMDEAVEAAMKIGVDTILRRWAVPFLNCDVVRVEEITIDDDGEVEFAGDVVLTRCKAYGEEVR